MSNEEKILTLLGEMKADMTEMKADMTEMKADMTEMKADMTEMKADISGLKQGQADVISKLDKLDSRVASLETETREIRHYVEGIDLTTRKLWGHTIAHSSGLGTDRK